jgi:hypothetical protein
MSVSNNKLEQKQQVEKAKYANYCIVLFICLPEPYTKAGHRQQFVSGTMFANHWFCPQYFLV